MLPSRPEHETRTVAVIPACNEAARVGDVIHAVFQSRLVDGLVIVDDGSTDDTLDVAQQSTEQAAQQIDKPFEVVSHDDNQGKTEALVTGIETAKALGDAAVNTLVFLDADSSPIWSRDTIDNMKVWQIVVNKFGAIPLESPGRDIIDGRRDVFKAMLARYIDEIASPVVSGEKRMTIGRYERNVVTDSALSLVGWGGHAGNRALQLADWEDMMQSMAERGLDVSGWTVEAALNAYYERQDVSTFIMRGVVNVGSRQKTGSMVKGIARMAQIHGQAIRAGRRYKSHYPYKPTSDLAI